jgi:hypothetical protein
MAGMSACCRELAVLVGFSLGVQLLRALTPPVGQVRDELSFSVPARGHAEVVLDFRDEPLGDVGTGPVVQ